MNFWIRHRGRFVIDWMSMSGATDYEKWEEMYVHTVIFCGGTENIVEIDGGSAITKLWSRWGHYNHHNIVQSNKRYKIGQVFFIPLYFNPDLSEWVYTVTLKNNRPIQVTLLNGPNSAINLHLS